VPSRIWDAAAWGIHQGTSAFNTAVSWGKRQYHAVTKWATPYYQKAVRAIKTAVQPQISFAKGFLHAAASTAAGAVNLAVSPFANLAHSAGGCFHGSLQSCVNIPSSINSIVDPIGTMIMQAPQMVAGIWNTGKSIYHEYTHGQAAYATGQVGFYAAMIALTKGIGLGADAGAATATATDLAPEVAAGAG
jgi:hypothetical protein